MAIRGTARFSDSFEEIKRPQCDFKDKINNYGPFVPRITKKPNALPDNPLPKALVEYNSTQDSSLPLPTDESVFEHPYTRELEALEFSREFVEKVILEKPAPLTNPPCEVISTKNELLAMLKRLKQCTEIAVDLEGHTYHSFQGFTCLLQISTQDEDFLIDTIALRSQIRRLNKIFTNPGIVKVFHGSEQDIEWLQRDFGVYVVNLFDTAVAARTVGHHKSSLDYLLSEYCNVRSPDKREMQMADWRVRPISVRMRRYAQKDTHYLLYIYEILKNELLHLSLQDEQDENDSQLLKVLNESRKICLRTYKKPTANGFFEKNRNKLNDTQCELFRLLCEWRDKLARDLDESMGYVMPNNTLLQIAKNMPRSIVHFLSSWELKRHPLIKQHAQQIQEFVKQALRFANPPKDAGVKRRKEKQKPRKRHSQCFEDSEAKLAKSEQPAT